MGEVAVWLEDLLTLPTRMREVHRMAKETQAALSELNAAVAEAAGDIEKLVDDSTSMDAETAAAIRANAQKLRDLVPDEEAPPVDPPVDPPA